jgi:hypothetical protein
MRVWAAVICRVAAARVIQGCVVSMAAAALVLLCASSASALTGGTQRWVSRFSGPGAGVDVPLDVAVSPDGSRVFVTGWITETTPLHEDYATVAYDASTGARLWLRYYNGPGNGRDIGRSVAVSPDGAVVFITGGSAGTDSDCPCGDDYATLAYSASTGKTLWVSRYNGPGNAQDDPTAIATSPDGSTVFVTGNSGGATSGGDYTTVAYSAATGRKVWIRRYNGPGNFADNVYSLVVSADGSRVFVTGESFGLSSGFDYATLAYAASTGNRLWVRRYNGPENGNDTALSVAVSPDGSTVLATGYSIGAANNTEFATIAYDASSGSKVWLRRYGGPGANGAAGASFVAVSPDGSKVFVTGSDAGATSDGDYATVAYSTSTGARLWLSHYNGPANGEDVSFSLAVSPDGSKVFVVGRSTGTTSDIDYATVAYGGSTGTRVWVRRYNGPANSSDEALSVAVSPDGSAVFVTGDSAGKTSFVDYLTVAYTA